MQTIFIENFIEASQFVLNKTAKLNIELGQITNKSLNSEGGSVGIYLGLTGKIKGQVLFLMDKKVACDIASSMTMRGPMIDLDIISRSAVTELMNIIVGRTASMLFERGLKIDITPPSFLLGDNLKYLVTRMNTVCIPFLLESGQIIEAEISVW